MHLHLDPIKTLQLGREPPAAAPFVRYSPADLLGPFLTGMHLDDDHRMKYWQRRFRAEALCYPLSAEQIAQGTTHPSLNPSALLASADDLRPVRLLLLPA